MNVPIYKSRRFWLLIFDTLISVGSYLLAHYARPEIADEILTIIGYLQPVVVFLIIAYTVDDTVQRLKG
jgi:hypothetical protein